MDFPLLAAALFALTFVAAVTDARAGIIPNWLTLPALAIAPPLQLLAGGRDALVASLLGCAVCAVVPLVMFRLGAMGGGDVKLLGAIGALAGPTLGLELQLLAYNVLVGFALAALARRGQLRAVLRRALRLVTGRPRAHDPAALTAFRLGVPIFVATVALLSLEAAR